MKNFLLTFISAIALFNFTNAQSWQDVGGGTNNSSHCMIPWNGQLVNGGSFGSPCGRIAEWNGTTWTCFAGGVGIVCRDVIEYNGDLIACGDFWNVNQPCVGCNGVARWDGTAWQPLGTGFNNDVLCLTIWNGQLVAGGDFTTADGLPSDRVAVWNGTNWYSLGGFTTSFSNDVRCMAMYNGELWVGGDFNNVNGCTACDGVVKWNGTAWVGGNSGVDIPGGVDSTVRVLYVNAAENKLYLAGHFTNLGGNTACSRIGVYDGSVWAPLMTGVNDYIRAVTFYNGNIIVGGDFTNASGTPAVRVAKWNYNMGTWSAMGTGMNDYVKSAAVWNGTLYVGGPFTVADGQPRSYIASWYETPSIPPAANFFSSSNAICLGQCISLVDSSANLPTAWNWTFNGANPPTSTLQNPTNICYNTPGTYTITLQACNISGCSTMNQTITVSNNSQPIVTVNGSPTTICSGTPSTLTASGASTYQWGPATGLSATIGASVIATPTVTTTYTVTGNSLGCTNTDSVLITVNPAPIVSVTPATVSICPSSSAVLTASGGTSYVWSPATGLSATTGASVTASPTATTTYTVTGTGTNGCTASATSIVTVGGGIPIPFSEGFQNLPFLPTGWTMNDGGNDGNIWQLNTSVGGFSATGNCAWYNNNGINAPNTRDEMQMLALNFSSLTTAQMTFDVAYTRKSNASFSDTCVVYVSTNCGVSWTQVYSKGGSTLATAPNQNGAFTPTITQWRTETVNLTPYINNQSVIIKFQNRNHNGNNLYIDNINIIGTNTNPPAPAFSMSANPICAGTCADFTDNSNGLPTAWNWTFTGGTPASSTLQNPTNICWSTAGTYSVTLQACNTNGCSTVSQNILVTIPNANAGVDDTVCTGGNITLGATGGVSYVWSPSGSLNCSTCQNPVATPPFTTTYTVTVTDASGCTNTDVVTITVLLCTGTNQLTSAEQIKIYPNPSNGKFVVEAVGELAVFNILGENIFSQKLIPHQTEIDLSNQSKGIYFLKVQNGDKISTHKIIIQ